MSKKLTSYLKTLKVPFGKKVNLKSKFVTDCDKKPYKKDEGEELLAESVRRMAELQDVLYASRAKSVLIVLQARDAAGKDGAVKHVMSGMNPQGVKVSPFKAPNNEELSYDYLWRHYKALPAKGEIRIFNRSHYENVLVTRVHPDYLNVENIEPDKMKTLWKDRFDQINNFEKHLTDNGTLILKIFLHVSKDTQKERFLERIDDPSKNWKFSEADINERKLWSEYSKAYADMLKNTSTDYAPWYVVPADDKWFARLCIGMLICNLLEEIDMKYPSISNKRRQQLMAIKEELINE